eukprot:5862908-Pyramimonas_sp.AAC.1
MDGFAEPGDVGCRWEAAHGTGPRRWAARAADVSRKGDTHRTALSGQGAAHVGSASGGTRHAPRPVG